MTMRSLYPSEHRLKRPGHWQNYVLRASTLLWGKPSQPESQAFNLPQHTQALRDLKQTYALERRCFL